MAAAWSKEELKNVSVGSHDSNIQNLSKAFGHVHNISMMEKFLPRLPKINDVDLDLGNAKLRLLSGQSTPYEEYYRALRLWTNENGPDATFGAIFDIFQDEDILWTNAVDKILAFKHWEGVRAPLEDTVPDEDMIESSEQAKEQEAPIIMVRKWEPPLPAGSRPPENAKYVKLGKLAYADNFQIGSGVHGFVCYGYFETPRKKAAVKVISSTYFSIFEQEISILRDLEHSNIIQYYCQETSGTSFYIAMELADVDLDRHIKNLHAELQKLIEDKHANLQELIKNKNAKVQKLVTLKHAEVEELVKYQKANAQELVNQYAEVHDLVKAEHAQLQEVIRDQHAKVQQIVQDQHAMVQKILPYLSQISEGLQFMHDKDIIHRDIKPSNIVLTGPDRYGNRIAKITDFGISKHLINPSESTAKGTSIYMSPECIFAWDAKRPFLSTKESDMYSLGLTFFYALTIGEHAAGSPVNQPLNLLNGNITLGILEQPERITHFHLVKSLLQYSSKQRPTIDSIMGHPSFWKPERSLQFITEVSNFLSTEDVKIRPCKQALEDHYKKSRFYVDDWTAKLCPSVQVFARDGNPERKHPKKYCGSKIIKLIEFIRDKDNHYGDWPAELKDASVFGDGPDGNSIFIRYFLDKFPFLIILLFIEFQPYATERKLAQFYSNIGPINSWSLSFDDSLC